MEIAAKAYFHYEPQHQNEMMNLILAQSGFLSGKLDVVLYGLAAVVLLVGGILLVHFGMIYLRALFSGAKVTFTELIALRLRRIPLSLMVGNRIAAVRSGVPLSIDELSTHYLAGGDVSMVVLALIAARKAGIHLIFDRACAIDLATKGTGKSVIEAVRTSINPRVIECPGSPPRQTKHRGRGQGRHCDQGPGAGHRAHQPGSLRRRRHGGNHHCARRRRHRQHHRFVGVYKDMLENPHRISQTVLDKALDANTAFEILSLDIADVDVGTNIGAKLQAEQAEANKLIAQAHAEIRRAAAVAGAQEMTARVAEMRSRVVEAEAQVPMAVAGAFRAGHVGMN